MNDTLTLTMIVVLLFGAVCMYLYMKIQQVEQKLSITESILLELKLIHDMKAYPEPPASMDAPITENDIEELANVAAMTETSDIDTTVQNDMIGINDVDHLDNVNTTNAVSTDTDFIPESLHTEQKSDSVVSDHDTSRSKMHNVSSVSPNYESLTLKELQHMAKQRHISGVTTMRRAQLIDALHAYDKNANTKASEYVESVQSSLDDFIPATDIDNVDNFE